MDKDIDKKFSSHLCAKCGMSAPDWRCPGCKMTSATYDPRHFAVCSAGKKFEAQCSGCLNAESNCTCV